MMVNSMLISVAIVPEQIGPELVHRLLSGISQGVGTREVPARRCAARSFRRWAATSKRQGEPAKHRAHYPARMTVGEQEACRLTLAFADRAGPDFDRIDQYPRNGVRRHGHRWSPVSGDGHARRGVATPRRNHLVKAPACVEDCGACPWRSSLGGQLSAACGGACGAQMVRRLA